jgi:hypothetical protein
MERILIWFGKIIMGIVWLMLFLACIITLILLLPFVFFLSFLIFVHDYIDKIK